MIAKLSAVLGCLLLLVSAANAGAPVACASTVTWNPSASTSAPNAVFSNGNLDVACNGQFATVISNYSVSIGKWYWEVDFTANGIGWAGIQVAPVTVTNKHQGTSSNGNQGTPFSDAIVASTAGTQFQVKLDLDGPTCTLSHRDLNAGGSYAVTPVPCGHSYFAAVWDGASATNPAFAARFNEPFVDAVPDGFVELGMAPCMEI